MAEKHVQPLMLVSFRDPGDIRRAYEALRGTFTCEFEDGGLLVIGGSPSEGWTLEHNERADQAYREAERQVSAELQLLESQGIVPTLEGKHASRPDPNQLHGWAKVFAWLLVEDPAGGEAGRRLAGHTVIGAFNDRIKELDLPNLLVQTSDTRRFYTALRATVPGVCIESTNRTYISCVDWTDEAKQWRNLPPFRAPYER